MGSTRAPWRRTSTSTIDGGAWSQLLELNAFDAAIADQYGFSVAIHGDVVVVGAPLKDDAILGEDAADANDDGLVNVADPVMLLSFLFVPQTPPLPAPFPACEGDPTPGDPIGCDAYGVCP